MQMQIIFHVTIQKKRLQYPEDTPADFKVQSSSLQQGCQLRPCGTCQLVACRARALHQSVQLTEL